MIGLLQRVTNAAVEVEDREIARIGPGLLVLVGVERGDDEATAERLLERLVTYRVFADAEGRMNLSLVDAGGGLLLVPQFTLAADTAEGPARRDSAGRQPPADAERLFGHMAKRAEKRLPGDAIRPVRRPYAGIARERRTRHVLAPGPRFAKAVEGNGVS